MTAVLAGQRTQSFLLSHIPLLTCHDVFKHITLSPSFSDPSPALGATFPQTRGQLVVPALSGSAL